MRHEIVVFFFIVLIISAGCTSAQNVTSTGQKNQNPAIRDINIKTSSASVPISPSDCIPTDPVHFQKFFPNVAGYKPQLPLNRTVEYRSEKSYSEDNSIKYTYIATQVYYSDNHAPSVIIHFFDMGPCVTESTGWSLNGHDVFKGTKKIDNFHGYPALQLFMDNGVDFMEIGISNRRVVSIQVQFSDEKVSYSEQEAVFEKFASAIDFNGFASVV
jgi:hypothetical protein